MAWWGSITWDIARAGGLTAYALLTLSVALGLALSLRLQTPRWPRIMNYELHNFITLLGVVFTVIHVAAVWVDPFTRFGWYEVFVPFASHYRPLWMLLGIVGWYLLIAVAVSTWLQRLIGYAWWRRLHFLTFAVYALSTVHGIATGSDTRSLWVTLLYILSTLLVGSLLLARLVPPGAPRTLGRVATAAALSASLLVLAAWSVAGPLRPNWNQIANNGQGSGSRVDIAVAQPVAQSSASAATAFSQTFQSDVTGTITQSGPDSKGVVTIQIDAKLTSLHSGVMRIQIYERRARREGNDDDGAGGDEGAGSWQVIGTRVQLGTTADAPIYVGPLDGLGGFDWQALVSTAAASPARIQLHIQLNTANGSAVQGTVQGQPA